MKTQQLWTGFQGLSVVAALTLPVVARLGAEEPRSLEKSPATLRMPAWASPTAAAVHMTSRVLNLPTPDELSRPEGLEITVEARQMRFEHQESLIRTSASSDRSPAGMRGSRWRLKELRRVSPEGTAVEQVDVVHGEGMSDSSSTFVELNEGSNIFEAVFVDPSTGRTSSYRVRVKHARGAI